MDKIILLLDQHEIDPSVNIEDRDNYFYRRAVRAVLRDENGKVALMYAALGDYYKLPGGGVDEGESLDDALARELLEETGCKIIVKKELGIVLEWRDFVRMHQASYAYEANVDGDIGNPSFTQSELDEGFELRWINSIDEAIKLVHDNAKRDDLGSVFLAKRDVAILRAAT